MLLGDLFLFDTFDKLQGEGARTHTRVQKPHNHNSSYPHINNQHNHLTFNVSSELADAALVEKLDSELKYEREGLSDGSLVQPDIKKFERTTGWKVSEKSGGKEVVMTKKTKEEECVPNLFKRKGNLEDLFVPV